MACDTVIDSYGTANRNSQWDIDNIGEYVGQAFTMGGIARDICKAQFYLNLQELDLGEDYTINAQIRACTGTVGTNGIPTGAALATSDGITITYGDAGWNAWTVYDFTFSTPYTLNASTDYCILGYITDENCSTSDDLQFGIQYSGAAHAGNNFYYQGAGPYYSNRDTIFYMYYDAGVGGWTGIIDGVTNLAYINGVAVANIAKVNGVT